MTAWYYFIKRYDLVSKLRHLIPSHISYHAVAISNVKNRQHGILSWYSYYILGYDITQMNIYRNIILHWHKFTQHFTVYCPDNIILLCKIMLNCFLWIAKCPFKKFKIFNEAPIAIEKSFRMICSKPQLRFCETVPLRNSLWQLVTVHNSLWQRVTAWRNNSWIYRCGKIKLSVTAYKKN